MPIKAMLADRKKVQAIVDPDPAKTPWRALSQAKLISDRVNHSIHVLEEREGDDLTAAALLAVYTNCVTSVAPSSHDETTRGVVTAIHASTGPLTSHSNTAISDDLFQRIREYVNFQLFHSASQHVKSTTTLPKPDRPDFHQLLGMLHQYPVLLRPLGLALDFEDVDLGNQSLQTLQTLPGFTAHLEGPEKEISGIDLVSLYTSCVINPSFVASSADNTHKNRFLDISDRSIFRVITEDSDGSAQKLIHQKRSSARGQEYKTTSVNLTVNDNRPSQTLPSSRTKGLSLLWEGRKDFLARQIARNDDDLGTQAKPLALEDLTLGYRLDVRETGTAQWNSLHLRESSYRILDATGKRTLLRWKPEPIDLKKIDPTEPYTCASDEGYTTLGSGVSQLPEDMQLKTHETLVTWNGWPLSIPRPKFDFNEKRSMRPGDGAPIVRIEPAYSQPAKIAAPRLRFDHRYDLRLRHVDLVGNSLPPNWSADEQYALPDNLFDRHEPLRGPQVLLEKPYSGTTSPGEQGTVMVLRDRENCDASRLLAPPREPFSLVELHGAFDGRNFPPGRWAFANAQLQDNGAFPSLAAASANHWLRDGLPQEGSAQNDQIYLLMRAPVQPNNPYWPDPLVRFVRIESYELDESLKSYSPAVTTKDPGTAIYLPFFPSSEWPQPSPVRIVLRHGNSLDIKLDPVPLADMTPSKVPAILVELPPGQTVLLQITSSSMPTATSPFNRESGSGGCGLPSLLRYRVTPEDDQATAAPPHVLPAGATLSLFNNLQQLSARLKQRVAPAAPASNPTPAANPTATPPAPLGGEFLLGDAVAEILDLHQQHPAASNPTTPPVGAPPPSVVPPPPPAAPSQHATDTFTAIIDMIPAAVFVDGSSHQTTPPVRITLVHAVSKPVDPPKFEPGTADSNPAHPPKFKPAHFPVTRQPGQSAAAMSGQISAHWQSTSKITVHATWVDSVDDLTQPGPKDRTTSEVAGELTNDGSPATPWRNINSNLGMHQFRDTRAHVVTYSLSAFTRFREFFPGDPNSDIDKFSRLGDPCQVTVCSSVRPPAPAILYVIPVFSWRECTVNGMSQRGRTMALRVYLARPFRVSGNRETIGVVFYKDSPNPSSAAQKLVSTWGGDPIVNSPRGIADYKMKPTDFITQENPSEAADPTTKKRKHWTPQDFSMDEGGTATVLPFNVDFHDQRGLWFCDLPLATSKVASAFVRLALARWQPDSLPDCLASQVVMADFIQIRSDRWVSVSRTDHHHISLAVTGVFPNDAANPVRLTCSVEQGWHGLTRDMQWRPVSKLSAFKPGTPDDQGLSTYTRDLELPGSMLLHEFRILIEESEWMLPGESDGILREPSASPNSRRTYMHYVNI
ncbi:hypothetical protein [Granulicella sp. L46]|uniref:hypothetical protein n=1 Tax=Granulicella sp. L46 TaxID=1641865 RepID=UPI00131B4218|nr:hypothetical protein [Granulicella sp. L46]